MHEDEGQQDRPEDRILCQVAPSKRDAEYGGHE